MFRYGPAGKGELMAAGNIILSGKFDSLRAGDVRFIHEASRLGSVHLLLWSDDLVTRLTGNPPQFPVQERQYFLGSLRYVSQLSVITGLKNPDLLPEEVLNGNTATWAVSQDESNSSKMDFCRSRGVEYRVIYDNRITGFPDEYGDEEPEGDKVVVTGCFDWFHSGHVRFFEEVSQLGNLYVIVGHDANIRLLKGEGHPLFSEEERRYLAGSIRYVTRALISSGHGWMDGEPEILGLNPEMYAVNEDGDKPEKRKFCEEHGIQYIVLKRIPKEGLPARTSTNLRGF